MKDLIDIFLIFLSRYLQEKNYTSQNYHYSEKKLLMLLLNRN